MEEAPGKNTDSQPDHIHRRESCRPGEISLGLLVGDFVIDEVEEFAEMEFVGHGWAPERW